jgi:hypothetical protein
MQQQSLLFKDIIGSFGLILYNAQVYVNKYKSQFDN